MAGIGIGNSYVFGGSRINPYLSQYLTRLAAEGGSITGAEQGYLNTFLNSIQASEFDRLWVHGLSNQIAARISLVNALTADLITEVNAPTWTANEGYQGNGTTQYLDTNYNPTTNSVKLVQNSGTHFIYIRTNIDQLSNDSGQFNNVSSVSGFLSRYTNISHCALNQDTSTITTWENTDSRGLFLGNRTNSTRKDYLNGVEKANYTAASQPFLNLDFFLLGRNNIGALSVPSTRQISLSGYGSGIIDQAAFYTATQALGTSIGWAV